MSIGLSGGIARGGESDRALADADALFSGGHPPRLVIQIPEAAMEVLRTEVHSPGKPPSRASVLVSVLEGAITYTNVTLHLKGRNSFRPIDQKPSMTLSFAPNGKGQRFHGLRKLSLNNSVSDAAYVCEALGRELFAAAGIPVPRATHAVVELNGRELGLFVLTEGWDKEFLKRHFSDPEGNLYEHAPGARDVTFPLPVISGEDPKDRGALQALAAAAGEPDASKRWAALGITLDREGFLTFMAMESLIGHWDGYCRHQNNFKLFHDHTRNRMVFLPHGLDQVFGTPKETGGLPVPLLGQMRGIVAAAILETEEGRRRYLERLEELHTTVFNVGRLTNRVIELAAQLHPFLTSDSSALSSNQVAVERLLERIPSQYNHVGQQLLMLRTPMAPGTQEVIGIGRWDPKFEVGSPGITKIQTNGQVFLQIGAHGQPASKASWRATYLLEPGRYRFKGDVLVKKSGSDDTNRVAALRASEAANAASAYPSATWTNLTCEFTVTAKRYVDLICEYQGDGGFARFDSGSLTLTHLGITGHLPAVGPSEVERKGATQ